MAATTKLLQLRPKPLSTTAAAATSTSSSIHFFSSSTTPDPINAPTPQPNAPPPPPPPPPQKPQSQSQFSSYFNDLKASLKPQQQRNPQQSQPPRKPFAFSSSISNHPNPPSKSDSLAEIRRNLSEYRRRAAAPPPSPPPSPSSTTTTSGPHSPQHISFVGMYQRNFAAQGEESSPDASAGTLAFEAIRESLRILKPSLSNNQSQGGGGMNNPMSYPRSRGSFKIPSQQRVLGGSDHLPASIFGRETEKKEEGNNSTDSKMRMEFFKTYRYEELGLKLRGLRPEKRDKKDWFSLEELSDRLVKMREMEEKERDTKVHGVVIRDLQESLVALKKQNEQSPRSPMHSLDILGQIGRTPTFMSYPPKEELVEKYFHPDNMSASEKLKLELGKVRDEFKMSESDCGSARVQVAQLTTKIKHLSSALHKKDKHSRKGLEAMVQRRKKLLKYLRRTDWDSYCFVLSKLGLRDNPDDIAKKKNYPSHKKDLSGKRKALKN